MNKNVPAAVDYLLKKNKVSGKKLCRETGLAYDYFLRVRRGAFFREDYIHIVCKYFKVTADYLFFFDPKNALNEIKDEGYTTKISELESLKKSKLLYQLEENFYYYIEDREMTISRIKDNCISIIELGIFYQNIIDLMTIFKVSCTKNRSSRIEFLDLKNKIIYCDESREKKNFKYTGDDQKFVLDAILDNILTLNFLETYVFSRILGFVYQGEENNKGSFHAAKKLFYEL
jgi:hypothetical protein